MNITKKRLHKIKKSKQQSKRHIHKNIKKSKRKTIKLIKKPYNLKNKSLKKKHIKKKYIKRLQKGGDDTTEENDNNNNNDNDEDESGVTSKNVELITPEDLVKNKDNEIENQDINSSNLITPQDLENEEEGEQEKGEQEEGEQEEGEQEEGEQEEGEGEEGEGEEGEGEGEEGEGEEGEGEEGEAEEGEGEEGEGEEGESEVVQKKYKKTEKKKKKKLNKKTKQPKERKLDDAKKKILIDNLKKNPDWSIFFNTLLKVICVNKDKSNDLETTEENEETETETETETQTETETETQTETGTETQTQTPEQVGGEKESVDVEELKNALTKYYTSYKKSQNENDGEEKPPENILIKKAEEYFDTMKINNCNDNIDYKDKAEQNSDLIGEIHNQIINSKVIEKAIEDYNKNKDNNDDVDEAQTGGAKDDGLLKWFKSFKEEIKSAEFKLERDVYVPKTNVQLTLNFTNKELANTDVSTNLKNKQATTEDMIQEIVHSLNFDQHKKTASDVLNKQKNINETKKDNEGDENKSD